MAELTAQQKGQGVGCLLVVALLVVGGIWAAWPGGSGSDGSSSALDARTCSAAVQLRDDMDGGLVTRGEVRDRLKAITEDARASEDQRLSERAEGALAAATAGDDGLTETRVGSLVFACASRST